MFFKWIKIPATLNITFHHVDLQRKMNDEFKILYERGDSKGTTEQSKPNSKGIVKFEAQFEAKCTMYISKSDGTARKKNIQVFLERMTKNGSSKLYGRLTLDVSSYLGKGVITSETEMETGRSIAPKLKYSLELKESGKTEEGNFDRQDVSFVEDPRKHVNKDRWDQTEVEGEGEIHPNAKKIGKLNKHQKDDEDEQAGKGKKKVKRVKKSKSQSQIKEATSDIEEPKEKPIKKKKAMKVKAAPKHHSENEDSHSSDSEGKKKANEIEEGKKETSESESEKEKKGSSESEEKKKEASESESDKKDSSESEEKKKETSESESDKKNSSEPEKQESDKTEEEKKESSSSEEEKELNKSEKREMDKSDEEIEKTEDEKKESSKHEEEKKELSESDNEQEETNENDGENSKSQTGKRKVKKVIKVKKNVIKKNNIKKVASSSEITENSKKTEELSKEQSKESEKEIEKEPESQKKEIEKPAQSKEEVKNEQTKKEEIVPKEETKKERIRKRSKIEKPIDYNRIIPANSEVPKYEKLFASVISHTYQQPKVPIYIDSAHNCPYPPNVFPIYATILDSKMLVSSKTNDAEFEKLMEVFMKEYCNLRIEAKDERFLNTLMICLLVNGNPTKEKMDPQRKSIFLQKFNEHLNKDSKSLVSSLLINFEVLCNRFATARFEIDQLLEDFNQVINDVQTALNFTNAINKYLLIQFITLLDAKMSNKLLSNPNRFMFSKAVTWNSFITAFETVRCVSLKYLRQIVNTLVMSVNICISKPDFEIIGPSENSVCPDLDMKLISYMLNNFKTDDMIPEPIQYDQFLKTYKLEKETKPMQIIASDVDDFTIAAEQARLLVWNKKSKANEEAVRSYPFLEEYLSDK